MRSARLTLLLQLLFALCCSTKYSFAIDVITKSEWGGRPAKSETPLDRKLKFVVIHHSDTSNCETFDSCSRQMRAMQKYHMDDKSWNDIGYNYAIGGDNKIYVGRGAGIEGAHSLGWNTKSYGIMFIGNFNNYEASTSQIARAHELLAWLVSEGYVDDNYTVYGHRQVRRTQCPGNKLYAEIQTWPNWRENEEPI